MEVGKRSDEVDVRVSLVTQLHVKWIVKFHGYIRSKPQLIKNGWKELVIMNRLNEKINKLK